MELTYYLDSLNEVLPNFSEQMILKCLDYQYMPAWKLCNILSLILLSYLLPWILEAVEEKMLDTSATDSYRCFLFRPSKVKILKFVLFMWKLIKMFQVMWGIRKEKG